MAEPKIALRAENLTKTYRRGRELILALDDISLDVRKGEFISFIGPSGSGKTTLLSVLGCLDNATSGRLAVGGKTVFSEQRRLSERELTKIRRQTFGYIFQSFYLLPTLNVYENVVLPFAFFRKPGAASKPMEILRLLGLDRRLNHRPAELSGGEMQRVAIARAVINDPEILLADEPTGNLDTKRSEEIGEILKILNAQRGVTVLLVTHNPALAKIAQRTVVLRDGKIVS